MNKIATYTSELAPQKLDKDKNFWGVSMYRHHTFEERLYIVSR